MAKNTGNDYRKGSVNDRSQFEQDNGDWQKRNDENGRLMDRKSSPGPFKGVAKEPDGRQTQKH